MSDIQLLMLLCISCVVLIIVLRFLGRSIKSYLVLFSQMVYYLEVRMALVLCGIFS